MSGTTLIIVLLALAAVAFHLGRRRAFAVSASSGGTKHLHSLPNYYGSLTALWCALPAIVIFGLWMSFEPQIVESLVVTTVTVQIVTLLVGDQEFDSPKTLAAFALGLVLFTVTLCLNVIALQVVRKYREQYD